MKIELLDTHGVGDLLGIKPETVRWYHKRGVLPPCDQRFGRTPVWHKSTIEDWQRKRTEMTEVPITSDHGALNPETGVG